MALPNLLGQYGIQAPAKSSGGLPDLLGTKYATPQKGPTDAQLATSKQDSTNANSLVGILKNTIAGLPAASGIPQAFNAGVSQFTSAFKPAPNEIQAQKLERSLNAGAGVINTVFSPLAPVFSPISHAINAAGKALQPVFEGYGKDVANLPVEQTNTPERILQAIQNVSVIGQGLVSGLSAIKGKVPTEVPPELVKIPVAHAESIESPISITKPPRLQIEAPQSFTRLQQIEQPKLLGTPKKGTAGEGFTMAEKPDASRVALGKAVNDYQTALNKYNSNPTPAKLEALIKLRQKVQDARANVDAVIPVSKLVKPVVTPKVAVEPKLSVPVKATTAPSEALGTKMPQARTTQTLKPIEGTGPIKTPGASKAYEAAAIEKGLVDSFGDLPETRSVNFKDQAVKVGDLIQKDSVVAREIALGNKAAPTGVIPEMVANEVSRRALAEGDVQTIRDLANSKLARAGTTMGRRIAAYGQRDAIDPVAAIQEVQKARAEAQALKGESVPKVTERIKASIRKTNTKETWGSFVESITC